MVVGEGAEADPGFQRGAKPCVLLWVGALHVARTSTPYPAVGEIELVQDKLVGNSLTGTCTTHNGKIIFKKRDQQDGPKPFTAKG